VKYKEKALKIKEMMFRANGIGDGAVPGDRKWTNLEHLNEYLEPFGCRVKREKRRRKGYLVVYLYSTKKSPICVELTVDFAEKVLAMGGFP